MKLLHKIKKLENDESDISELENTNLHGHYRRITFMGMVYHGKYRFSANDTVKLQKDDNSPKFDWIPIGIVQYHGITDEKLTQDRDVS